MLDHGGAIIAASRRWGIPPEKWIDLSIGVNPNAWPCPAVPCEAWQRLPQSDDQLKLAAQEYFQCQHVLPTAGTQAALMVLPALRAHAKVAILSPTYSEHARAWLELDHDVVSVEGDELATAASNVEVMIVANPNNPTAYLIEPEYLLNWCDQLAARGGWLIVDEAFVDATPEVSTIRGIGKRGLIVLRSFGKFFGLPGARVGFVLAWQDLLKALEERLGPWPVNGPARWVAAQALCDWRWHEQARIDLQAQSARLGALLASYALPVSGSTAFFHWVVDDRAYDLHEFLARRGILTRLFEKPLSLRFGLPRSEADWHALTEALDRFAQSSIVRQALYTP